MEHNITNFLFSMTLKENTDFIFTIQAHNEFINVEPIEKKDENVLVNRSINNFTIKPRN